MNPEIKNLALVYDDWKATDCFQILSAFYVHSDKKLALELLSANKSSDKSTVFKIKMEFNDISGFHIDESTFNLGHGFDILDVSENKWEDVNFEIKNYENGSIGFYCAEISIIHCQKI